MVKTSNSWTFFKVDKILEKNLTSRFLYLPYNLSVDELFWFKTDSQ